MIVNETGSAGAVAGVGGMIVGASNSVLNWVDAFCATERCKNAKLAAAQGKEAAELGVQAQQYAALAAAQTAKAAQSRQTTMLILGGGALGLAALYILMR